MSKSFPVIVRTSTFHDFFTFSNVECIEQGFDVHETTAFPVNGISMYGKEHRQHSTTSPFVFTEERKSYGFDRTWEWVNGTLTTTSIKRWKSNTVLLLVGLKRVRWRIRRGHILWLYTTFLLKKIFISIFCVVFQL